MLRRAVPFCLTALVASLSARIALASGDDDLFGSNVVLNIGKDSFDKLDSNKAHFIKFYAPWCGHCKRLAPTWEELAEKFNTDSDKVAIGKVDCTEQAELCSQHEIAGYPTLKFFEAGSKTGEKYKGSRDIEDLHNWVLEKIGVVKADEATKGLVILDAENFMEHIKTGKHFIKFYAPWCGHCKNLAPTWDQLATKLADNNDVTIAKVDCTQHGQVCKDMEVKGYPTLLWFVNGKIKEKYTGARSLSELEAYVQKMSTQEQEKAAKVEKQRKERKEAAAAGGADSDAPILLDDDSFDGAVADGVSFVKFYAPWCGHCKHLAPTWADLAKKVKNQAKIAKVDCTENESLCTLHEVQGYPTLILYKDGKKVEEYHGGRDLDALHEFVSKHATDGKKDEL